MTEKEKMLANQLYDPSDAELVQLRRLARNKMMEFNHLNDDELPKRKEILQSILGHLGKDSFIETGLLLDYGCNTYIGNDCFINYNCTILDCAKVVIKDNVFIGPADTAFTLIFFFPKLSAKYLTLVSSAALATPITLYPGSTFVEP